MFSALCGTGNHNDRNKRKRDENTALAYRKLPGKIGKCLCSDGKVKPCGFGKNHPRRGLAVFFPKTLPYRRHLPSGPCSSRAAKARIFTIKKKRDMNQAFATSAPPAPMRMPMPVTRRKRTVEPELAVKFPPRGTTGPVHSSTLSNPILEICHHPDRNRLLAKLFSEE